MLCITLHVPCHAGTVVVAPCCCDLVFFPPLPYQNTSELEEGGDGHQSSVNTLPDISLVRHCTMLLHLGGELEAKW